MGYPEGNQAAMTPSEFYFNEAEHRYFLGTRELPGVTRVLDGFLTDFSFVDPFDLEQARILGNQVHKATALDDRGVLDEDHLNDELPRVMPYVRGWRLFRREMGFVPTSLEEPGYHLDHGFAGTRDRRGHLYQDRKLPQIIIDIKRRDMLTPDVGPQTAAYELIDAYMSHRKPRTLKRACVRLFPDSYKYDELKEDTDYSVFLSCLNLYNYRQRYRRFFRG